MDKTDQPKAQIIQRTESVREPHSRSAHALPGSIARINSKQLFGGAEEIEINHNGIPYRLRQTSLGKLILTK